MKKTLLVLALGTSLVVSCTKKQDSTSQNEQMQSAPTATGKLSNAELKVAISQEFETLKIGRAHV